jgi:hypothetical protein
LTNPVLNQNSPLVDTATGKVIPPWNSFFQQFTQKAAAVQAITLTGSPFSYTPNSRGNVVISGGTVSAIALIRGLVTIPLSTVRPFMVYLGIGDTIKVTYTVVPTIQFLEL